MLVEVGETHTAQIEPEGSPLTYEVLLPAYLAERLRASVGKPVTLITLQYLEGQGQGTEPARELAFFSDRLGFSISILHFDPLPAHHAVDDEVELIDTYDKLITNGHS